MTTAAEHERQMDAADARREAEEDRAEWLSEHPDADDDPPGADADDYDDPRVAAAEWGGMELYEPR